MFRIYVDPMHPHVSGMSGTPMARIDERGHKYVFLPPFFVKRVGAARRYIKRQRRSSVGQHSTYPCQSHDWQKTAQPSAEVRIRSRRRSVSFSVRRKGDLMLQSRGTKSSPQENVGAKDGVMMISAPPGRDIQSRDIEQAPFESSGA